MLFKNVITVSVTRSALSPDFPVSLMQRKRGMLLLSDLNLQTNSDLEKFRFEGDSAMNFDG